MIRYQFKFPIGLLFSFFVLHIIAQESNLIVIDLKNPIVEHIPMSRMFSDIEYIQLENRDNFKFNKKAVYYLSNEYIIVANIFDGVFAFDRKTGQFVKQISEEGGGDGKYLRMPIFNYGFDEKNDVFFFDDYQQWKGVEMASNKEVVKITKPKERRVISLPNKESGTSQAASTISSESSISDNANEGWKQGSIFNPWSLGNGKYAGFVNNSTGNIDVGLVIFDVNGKVLKSFPNTRKYERELMSSPVNSGQFYAYDGETYFKEFFYNDTVFHIKDEALIPHILFDTGDKQLPYESLSYDFDKRNDDKYKITFVQETDLYIFFNFLIYDEVEKQKILFSGYYDKKLKKTFVCKAKDGFGGFIDDINGLSSFNPLYINSKEELIGKLSSSSLEQYDESKLSELGQTIFKKMKKSNNPVIVITHLKGEIGK